MKFKDLRTFVNFLEEQGELLRIKEELDPKFEVSAAIRYGGGKTGKAVLVEKVKGYACPVVGNLLGTRERMAMAIGATGGELVDRFLLSKEDLIPPQIVDTGPIKEVVVRDNINLLENMPVLTNHEDDVSPYITQGLVFMRDRETGFNTMGVHRLQVKSNDRLGIFLASSTSTEIFRKAEKSGEALDVVVVIGVDPITLLSSIVWAPFGDKFEVAGALRGSPLEMVRAETVDIAIPAHAMFALEGKILPRVRDVEGPFGESTGYYITADNPVIKIDAITHQRDPIYPVFIPWDKEDDIILDVTFTPYIYNQLKKMHPSIVGVKLFGIAGVAVISIDKRYEAEPREILYSILSTYKYLKIAMVVDGDVEVDSEKDVAWAWGTRFYPERDLILVDSVSGSPIDPTAEGNENIVSKLGIDATKPLYQRERFRKVDSPIEVKEKIRRLFKTYLP